MTLPIPDLKKAVLSFLNNLKSVDINKETLVSFAYKLDETDFLSIIDPLLTEDKKVFYFNRPEERLILLAFEEAYFLNITEENNFSILENTISDLSKKRISNFDFTSNDTFPLFLGGTKFSSGCKSEEWKDFADNGWFIPRFLFYKKGEDHWLILNFYIDAKYPPQDQLDFLITLERIKNNEFICQNNPAIIKFLINDNDREKWYSLISNALLKIEEGFFRKVVLSRRIVTRIKKYPLFSNILQELTVNYNNCTIFLYKSGNSVLFGATPEQLLKLNQNELEFDALAGSAKRGETEEEDNTIANNLISDNKNTQEHNYVIDFIREASLTYVYNLRQFDTRIKKYSNIQHIYTPIKAELKSSEHLYNLINAIYPTPAICGSPKGSALKYIKENEGFDRGMFSGIIGSISPEKMDLVVAIRSALLNDNNLYIYAGCGIVKGSDPASEYEETEIKMNTILSLFNNEN
ncbi:MAG: isochorismate synthase [Ignavibacteriaceae bacterium]|nr:isochorismate synthase [Ignavibacteriaceae bacterium]